MYVYRKRGNNSPFSGLSIKNDARQMQNNEKYKKEVAVLLAFKQKKI